MGQEEIFVGAAQSSVQIQDPALHVREDHIPVEAVARKHHDSAEYNYGKEHTRRTTSLQLEEILVKLHAVASFKIL